jgi:hypothetical protein
LVLGIIGGCRNSLNARRKAARPQETLHAVDHFPAAGRGNFRALDESALIFTAQSDVTNSETQLRTPVNTRRPQASPRAVRLNMGGISDP